MMIVIICTWYDPKRRSQVFVKFSHIFCNIICLSKPLSHIYCIPICVSYAIITYIYDLINFAGIIIYTITNNNRNDSIMRKGDNWWWPSALALRQTIVSSLIHRYMDISRLIYRTFIIVVAFIDILMLSWLRAKAYACQRSSQWTIAKEKFQ